MKKFTLLLMTLLTVMGSVSAKSFETTLWEDTYTSAIELNAETVATFSEGNVLRIYVTVPDGGANFKLYYKSDANGWTDTAIPSVNNQWPWVNGGNTYYDVTLTSDDITALSGQNIYIEKGDNSTIDKVVLTGEVTPTGETELLTENWTASWTAKTFAAQSTAKLGDVIRFSYSAPGGWTWYQFNILDAYGNADAFDNKDSNVATSIDNAADLYFDFEIKSVSDMVKIQTEGFGIKGDNFTLTSVKLLTYADSYDAVEVEIGADGIRTWSHTKNLDFTDTGITAYYASAVEQGKVSMTQTATTWNYCGYILQGAEGKYTVKVVPDEDATYPSATYLKAQTSEGEVAASATGAYHYIFGKDTAGNIGFFKLEAAHTLTGNMAYLETGSDITPANGARILIDFDSKTTDIRTIAHSTNSAFDNCYDLSGRKIVKSSNRQMPKGLYIVNGKKVIIK